MTSVNDFTLEEVPVSPTGQFKQSLDSFYITDSPLSLTNIGEISNVLFKLTSPNDLPVEEVPTRQFK